MLLNAGSVLSTRREQEPIISMKRMAIVPGRFSVHNFMLVFQHDSTGERRLLKDTPTLISLKQNRFGQLRLRSQDASTF